jgi:hypothetical protein
MQILHRIISKVGSLKTVTAELALGSPRAAGNQKMKTENNKVKETEKHMSTSTSTRDTTVSAEQIKTVMAAWNRVRGNLNLVSLTPQERDEYVTKRVNRLSVRALEDHLAAAQSYPELLPAAFDLAKFERDTRLVRALHEGLALVESTRDALKDTLLVVGTWAAEAATGAAAHIKVASRPGQKRNRRPRRRAQANDPAPAPGTTPGNIPTPTPTPPSTNAGQGASGGTASSSPAPTPPASSAGSAPGTGGGGAPERNAA